MKFISFLLTAHILLSGSPGIQAGTQPNGNPETQSKLEPKPKWPYPIPCRISDGPNKDLFIMTLGDVATTLADGTFDPAKDEVRLKDGTVKVSVAAVQRLILRVTDCSRRFGLAADWIEARLLR